MNNLETEILKLISLNSFDITDEFFENAKSDKILAIDIETTGLDWKTDSIQIIQLYIPNRNIQIVKVGVNPPCKIIDLLTNPNIKKIFHHAMFDIRFLYHKWKFQPRNIACTKIASKILNPELKQHNLKTLLKKKLEVSITKQLAKSDWSKEKLDEQQIIYAAKDVLYLPSLCEILESELRNKSKLGFLRSCYEHIPTRVMLEVGNYGDIYTY